MTSDPISGTKTFPSRKSRAFTFFLGLVVGVVLTLLVPYLLQIIDEALQYRCVHNMKHILLALHSYHDQYGSFPPAYTVDTDGKKLQSWRVLILLQLGEEELYRQIRLDEPWDSDHNKRFQTQMPEIFRCPADRSKRNRGETSYVWITGQGFISDGVGCTKMSDIADGTSNTLMLVETLNPICWTSPEDTTMESCWSAYMLGTDSFRGISSNHRVYANIGFVDGHVSSLGCYDFYTIHRLASLAGGEALTGL
jgi:prepilin-type processing-associated H-X9-DG protein